MSRFFLALLLLMLVQAGWADYVDVVKNTKNLIGDSCAEIPETVRTKLGFNDTAVKWVAERIDGVYRVSLKLLAQKDSLVDSLYVAYKWQPEWVWYVSIKDKSVQPANLMAQQWMEGKI